MSLTTNQLLRLGRLIKAGVRPRDAAALADRPTDGEVGIPNGLATLDGTGNVPASQLAHASGGGGTTLPMQIGQGGNFLMTDGAVLSWAVPLPSQTNNAGKYLSTNGAVTAWTSPPNAPVTSVAGKTGVVALAKADVGLGNVDNTPDATKIVSNPQTIAIAAAVAGVSHPVSSVAGKTGAVTLVKADVGLANVDNTSDVNKPVSTAQAAAIAAGTGAIVSVAGKTGTVVLVKADVGLANVDNTSDVNKPVSTAQAAAIAAASGAVVSVAGRTGAVALAKGDVGLASVDNTADAGKPVSIAQAAAIAAVIPSQAGNAYKKLVTDGTNPFWEVQSPDIWTPADNGLYGASLNPNYLTGNSTQMVSGKVMFARIKWNRTRLVQNIYMAVATAGITLTAGQNLIGLYTGAGVLIAGTTTPDQSVAWASTNNSIIATLAAPVSIPADPTGYILVGVLTKGTTIPIFRGVSIAGSFVSNGLAAATTGLNFGQDASSGNTTMPATLTMSTSGTVNPFFVGIGP